MNMYSKIRRTRILRAASLFFAGNLLAQICFPTVAYALTDGPSQPEVESFEPITTNQMVDLFSGDFTYNIPLLTVPGPNGGYPINMAYHSGIGMEQEASWVGLGWNINPGVINRNMRGLPDDFKGAVIRKEQYTKPNRNYSIGVGDISPEAFGADFNFVSGGAQIFYNNYKGVGMSFSMSFSKVVALGMVSMTPGLNYNYNSHSGVGLTPSFGLSAQVGGFSGSVNVSRHYQGREGEQSTSVNANVNHSAVQNMIQKATRYNFSGIGAGMTFTSGSTVSPHSEFPTTSYSYTQAHKQTWSASNDLYPKIKLTGSYSQTKQIDTTRPYKAFGYLYSESAEDKNMMDVNRDLLTGITHRTKNLSIPQFTYDTYDAKAQGFGGSFRPYRSSTEILHDPAVSHEAYSGTTVESEYGLLGLGEVHTGLDLQNNFSGMYSGPWIDDNFKNVIESNNNSVKHETYYMKANGEQTATPATESSYVLGDGPFAYKLNSIDALSTSNIPENTRESRERRMQHMSFRTINELDNAKDYHFPIHTLHGHASYTDMIESDDSKDAALGDQVGEISVLNGNGYRYVYGLPAYNLEEKQVTFAITSDDITTVDGIEMVDYDEGIDNDFENENGADHFYSMTHTPRYAHSYFLTAVYSSDYVDLKDDGPTEDDLGYYVLFDYELHENDYQWRVPYFHANYVEGRHGNDVDDKANYSWGRKQIYYLKGLQTKTHEALFTLEDRKDAFAASGEHSEAPLDDISGVGTMKALKRIDLYSKAAEDYGTSSPVPIKSVHFQYDYSLCKGAYNSIGDETGTAPCGNTEDCGGKLTLKKLFFTYGNNTKGALSPYEFSYDVNPDYAQEATDRWGNYKVPNEFGTTNKRMPYVNQYEDYDRDGLVEAEDTEKRNHFAAAWNLTKINMPSGAVLDINYESDDYAYVQNKRAMQSMQIRKINAVGTTLDTNASLESTDYKVYIEPESVPVSPGSSGDMAEYMYGISDLYFKIYAQLKNSQSDYVEGYARVDHSAGYGFEEVEGEWLGYFYVESVKIGDHNGHPFQRAALQHLRMNRTDLLDAPDIADDGDMSFEDIWTFFENFYEKNLEFFKGFYEHSYDEGYGDTIELSNADFPSIVRLNSPDHIKYGGGHRVQSVVLNDNWNEMTSDEEAFQYGQKYHYRLANGYSSGVAENEPTSGVEENALRQPIRSNDQAGDMILKHSDFYSEYPLGESYYPGASVGYSRVVVESITRDNDPVHTKTKDGKTVNEFYTAKDFPVMVSHTDLTGSYVKNDHLNSQFPLIGSINIEKQSYSQGYQIELNDMHGKAKSTATYAAASPLFAESTGSFNLVEPEQQVNYLYDTQGAYSPNKINRLDNKVDVLYQERLRRHDYLGVTTDFFVDTRESFSKQETYGEQNNLEVSPGTDVPSFTFFVRADLGVQHYRTATTARVIHKTGIQNRTTYLQDGSHYTQTNHLYDAETGSPLLSSTTNEFGNPIYDYNIPAHWYYEGLSGAYRNQGIKISIDAADVTSPVAGSIVLDDVDKDIFSLGDKLEITDTAGEMELFWVSALALDGVDDEFEDVTVSNVDGDAISIDDTDLDIHIVASGRKNGLETMAGYIKYLNLDEGSPITDALSGDLSLLVYNTGGGVEDIPATMSTGHPFQTAEITEPHMGFGRLPYDYCDQTLAGDGSGLADNQPLYGFFYEEDMQEVLLNNAYFSTIEPYLQPYSLVILNSSFSSFYEENNNYNCYAQIHFPEDFQADFDVTDDVYGNLDNYSFENTVSGITATVSDPNSSFVKSYQCGWTDMGGCFELCPNVLDANAIEFSDEWLYSYDDYGTQDVENDNALSDTDINAYRYGKRGLWKPQRTNLYQVDRKQEGGDSGLDYKTDISRDGVYNHFRYFDWSSDADNSEYWTWATEITRYNPYGFEVENMDALGRYSSALYGYNNSLAVAVAKNAAYPEIAFDGFEDHHNINPAIVYQNHGHIDFDLIESDLTNYVAHTGDYSLSLSDETKEYTISYDTDFTGSESFKLIEGKTYLVSCWMYIERKSSGGIEVTQNAAVISGGNEHDNIVIDGWTKMEKQFTVGSTGDLKLRLISSHSDPVYFDDLRIQPVNSSMKAYVYQPGDLKLSAELDDQNMATYYNYDEEGILVQVKKETLQGVQTLKTTRNNTYDEE